MSAEAVINKINEKSKAECDAILAEGKEKAENAKNAILAETKRKADEIMKRADSQAELTLRSGAQQAELDNKLSALNCKYDLLEEVRNDAVKAMQSFDDKAWESLYTRLVLENIMAGNVEITVPKAYADKYRMKSYGNGESLIEYWSRLAAEKLGSDVNITLNESAEKMDGGLIICGESYDVDLTYGAVVGEAFDAHKKEISDCLFETEERA